MFRTMRTSPLYQSLSVCTPNGMVQRQKGRRWHLKYVKYRQLVQFDCEYDKRIGLFGGKLREMFLAREFGGSL